jgi:hypothetical protein
MKILARKGLTQEHGETEAAGKADAMRWLWRDYPR